MRPGDGYGISVPARVAAMRVLMLRDHGDFSRTRRLGRARFEHQVRAEVVRRGRIKPSLRILNQLWSALSDPAGVEAHRGGGFERIGWILDDWDAARTNQAQVEQHMTQTLEQLGLTHLVTSIDGLSPVGAAAILAETGDLTRFTSARAIVKLAGLAPRERLSGTFTGKARLSGAGRPGLRTAAWRAVWGCLPNNSVYATSYRHLTTREHNKLKPTQAQTVLAAALLRQLWAVITTGQAWDPAIAANGLARLEEPIVA